FRIGSTTKTFTGTTVMRLVEQGTLDLDATVRTYLPDFQTADPSVAARVTLRQLLNHSAGWRGDDFEDTGPGDDALARYVVGMAGLPQLAPLGTVSHYNNAAGVRAGHVPGAAPGATHERPIREQLLEPLGLAHSFFFSDEIVGFNVAASHAVVDGQPVVRPAFWPMPRSLHPTGGLISSARDQLRYARFHLGDGTAADGTRLLSARALAAMRTDPGPGGTLEVEIDGVGVNWLLRRTAEGVRVAQHGGSYAGQFSGFFFVPERGFALTVLTNAESGHKLRADLVDDDWALRQFVGLSNPPAAPVARTREQLAPYLGQYLGRALVDAGPVETSIELSEAAGGLRMRQTTRELATGSEETAERRLAFYRE